MQGEETAGAAELGEWASWELARVMAVPSQVRRRACGCVCECVSRSGVARWSFANVPERALVWRGPVSAARVLGPVPSPTVAAATPRYFQVNRGFSQLLHFPPTSGPVKYGPVKYPLVRAPSLATLTPALTPLGPVLDARRSYASRMDVSKKNTHISCAWSTLHLYGHNR